MENKTGKYFKYAIGEIVLVVIGILIALQINNWNENRKFRKSELVKLTKLSEDLKIDSLKFDNNLKILSDIDKLHKQLYSIGFNASNDSLTVNPNKIRKYIFYNPYSLKNSKTFVNGLSNEIIREQLLNYNDKLERGFITDNEFTYVVKNIRSYLSEKEVYNISIIQDTKFDEVNDSIVLVPKSELVKLSKNKDFQQLLFEANLKLKGLVQSIQENAIDNQKLKTIIKKGLKK